MTAAVQPAGCSGRSGITTASREIPSGSIISNMRSISLSVTALSKNVSPLQKFGHDPGATICFTLNSARVSSLNQEPERFRQSSRDWTIGKVPPINEAVVYGTIKKIIKDKGFGFIIPDDSGDEVFFHRSRLAPKVLFEDLREGNEVQFEVRPGEKGRQAFNLRLR